MDATTDQAHEFNGEAQEGTEPATDDVEVELVGDDGEGGSGPPAVPADSAGTRSGDDEGGAVTRSAGSTRSRGGDHLDEGETAASVLADNMLSDADRYARWQARRPVTSHLKEGVVFPPGVSGAVPLFDVGDRIVVETRSTDMGGPHPDPLDPDGPSRWPWFRTTVGRVLEIDDDTGVVVVNDEDKCSKLGYSVWRTYVRFTSEHHAFFLAPRFGDPFDASAVLAERREEQRKAAAALAGAPGAPVRRGRGRPPGSKNRPKEEIEAERAALRKLQDERRNRRKALRTGL